MHALTLLPWRKKSGREPGKQEATSQAGEQLVQRPDVRQRWNRSQKTVPRRRTERDESEESLQTWDLETPPPRQASELYLEDIRDPGSR